MPASVTNLYSAQFGFSQMELRYRIAIVKDSVKLNPNELARLCADIIKKGLFSISYEPAKSIIIIVKKEHTKALDYLLSKLNEFKSIQDGGVPSAALLDNAPSHLLH